MDATLADQIAEVKREIEMRRTVYDRLLRSGKLTAADAQARTERMVAVLATLERVRNEGLAKVNPMV